MSRKKHNSSTCIVKGCNKPYYAKNYCHYHYHKYLNHGDPLYKRLERKCKHPGCNRKYYAKGYCPFHYNRMRFGMDMDAPYRRYNQEKIDRNKAIKLMYDNGYTLQSIGDILGITRERVRQVVEEENAKNA